MSYKIKPTQTPVPFAIRGTQFGQPVQKNLIQEPSFTLNATLGTEKNQSNSFFFYIVNLIGYINSLIIGQNTHIKKYFYTT